MTETEIHAKFGGALRAKQTVWVQPAITVVTLRRRWFTNFMRRLVGVN